VKVTPQITATTLPPADLVAWRFGLGSVVLALISGHRRRLPPALLRRAVVLGALLGTGFLLQTWGLTYTDALTSGFLTSLLVVIAPLAGWLLFRERLSRATVVGLLLATAGLVLLGWHGSRLGRGELLTLVAATAWGLHVVLLSRWARAEHALAVARVQTVTVAAMALLMVALRSGTGSGLPLPELPPDRHAWASVVFLAVLASAAAVLLLSWAQSRVSSTRAAMVLTLEPAVAGLTAVLAGNQLTARILLGGTALLLAVYVVEVSGRGRTSRAVPSTRVTR
jgi:drug/metabolite transporter (DMT)-like permease